MAGHGGNGDILNAPDEGYCVICQRQFKGKRGLLSHNVVHRKKAVVEEPLSEADWDKNRTVAWENDSMLVAAGYKDNQALDPRGALNPAPIPPRPNPVFPPIPEAGAAKVCSEAAEPHKENVPKLPVAPLFSSSLVVVASKILQHSNHQKVFREKIYNVKDASYDKSATAGETHGKNFRLRFGAAYEEPELVAKSTAPLFVPYAMAPSPFHTPMYMHPAIPLEASVAMGVNRVMQFVFRMLAAYRVADNCLLIRFCASPSQLWPSDKRPHNLALQLNGKDILRPADFVKDFSLCVLEGRLRELKTLFFSETIDYRPTLKYQHAYSPVEVALDDVTDSNILVIEWTVADHKSLAEEFLFFLEISKKNTLDKICGDVYERKIGIDESVSRLYRDLSKKDDEVSANARNLSLICGRSLKRPEIPARGKHCRHLECFDLASFILMNQALYAKWLCPVCKGPVSFSDLVVDEVVEISAGADMIIVKEQKKPEIKTTKVVEVVNVEDTILCG